MPTVLRKDGFRFVIYPNDHEPPHVHVMKAGGEAKIQLGSIGIWPTIVAVFDMPSQSVAQALEITCINQEALIRAWEEIHGK